MQMNILDIIEEKRDAKELNKEEIEFFVKGYTDGSIPDYQAAALVMAIYINGMTKEETTNLALAMAYSGDVLDLSDIGEVVDKHSTGGIGDKITLILMPIVAALGVKVAKMSGRGLGATGGTKDKLEAIPGYRTEIGIDEFIENVKKIGISLIGQTLNLAPADKKLYALRDTISCTANIPLISSSIMSKKIAAGANKIVLDVTCGSGAFMKTVGEARELSRTMIDIGKLANKETVCIITNMDQPLGTMVGNILEVIEAIEALKGNMQDDVKNVVLELGAYILKLDGKGDNIQENKEKIEQVISNGDAYKKFLQLVENQGGDIGYIENTEKFTKAKYKMPVEAVKTGYVQKLNAEEVGKIQQKYDNEVLARTNDQLYFKWILTSVVGSLICIIAVTFLQKKWRKANALQKQIEELEEKKKVLTSSSQENERYVIQISELESQINDLKNEKRRLKYFINKTKESKEDKEDDYSLIFKTYLSITKDKTYDKERERDNLRQWLNLTNQNFTDKLIKHYPVLSKSNQLMDVCCLTALNLSIEDIATLLGIGERTVERYTSDICKKVGLPKGGKHIFVEFINSIKELEA